MRYQRQPRRIRPRNSHPLANYLRRPSVQLGTVLFVIILVIIIALGGRDSSGGIFSSEVDVDTAHQMYLNGAYMLDVSWQAEWDQFHIPNAVLIPLDQLYNHLAEIPKDRQILIVAHSLETSQKAADLLRSAGYNAVNMSASLDAWYAKGYPIEGAPPQ